MKLATANGRILKFLCVHDDSVRSVRDLGYTRDGEETGQRQAIKRMLSKKAMIDGQRVAIFLLAEPPTEEFSTADPLDEQMLRTQDGKWQLPSAAWLAVRDDRIAQAKAMADEASQRALAMATSDLATQLGGLMKQTAAAAAKGSR